MNPYTELATAYDLILEHVDYKAWYDYICSVMCRNVNNPRKILELGCGTGKFGPKFSADDFTVYGIDVSFEMLRIAKTRAFRNFHIFCSDMRNFALSEKMDFIFCVHDAMNYLLEKKDIRNVLRSVREVMHNDSVFMFDLTTEYNIKNNFENQITEYKSMGRIIEWSNTYDKKNKIVLSTLNFSRDDGTSVSEHHVQKIYSVKEITKLIISEGMDIIGVYGDHTFLPPGKKNVMINFVVRKK